MYIIYNESDYELGKSHYISKDATYIVLDEATQETSTLSGSSLRTRLKKELSSKNFTFKNVSYMSRPVLYQDIELGVRESRVMVDIQTGAIDGEKNGVDISCSPIKVTDGFITVNGLVLRLSITDLPVYDNKYRFKPYRLTLADSIQVTVNEDSQLRGIIFNKMSMKQSSVKFTLVFNIFNTVYFSYETSSIEVPVVIDFEKHLLITEDAEIALPTLKEYKSCGAEELKFSRFSKLSNYYDCTVFFDGRTYLSSEAAFQSMKTTDSSMRDKFSNLTPDESKALGRKVELRPDWESVKIGVMHDVVLAKFSQNQDCKDELLKTKGYNLVEDTTGWHDCVWGRCYCKKCRGVGKNHLGKILTSIRKELG